MDPNIVPRPAHQRLPAQPPPIEHADMLIAPMRRQSQMLPVPDPNNRDPCRVFRCEHAIDPNTGQPLFDENNQPVIVVTDKRLPKEEIDLTSSLTYIRSYRFAPTVHAGLEILANRMGLTVGEALLKVLQEKGIVTMVRNNRVIEPV